MTSHWLISCVLAIGQLSDSEKVAYQYIQNTGTLEDIAIEVSGEVFTVTHDITGDGVLDYAVSCTTCTIGGGTTVWNIYQKRDNQMVLSSYGFSASKDELFHFEDAEGVHLVTVRDFGDRLGVVPLELGENRGFKTSILKDVLKDSEQDRKWLDEQMEKSAHLVERFDVAKLKQAQSLLPPRSTVKPLEGPKDTLDAPVIDTAKSRPPVPHATPLPKVETATIAKTSASQNDIASIPSISQAKVAPARSESIPKRNSPSILTWALLSGAAIFGILVLLTALKR